MNFYRQLQRKMYNPQLNYIIYISTKSMMKTIQFGIFPQYRYAFLQYFICTFTSSRVIVVYLQTYYWNFPNLQPRGSGMLFSNFLWLLFLLTGVLPECEELTEDDPRNWGRSLREVEPRGCGAQQKVRFKVILGKSLVSLAENVQSLWQDIHL